LKSFQIGDLTIPIPIVQGGMGIGVSLSGLASAVANQGGVGTIAAVGIGLIHGSPDKSYRQNNIEGLTNQIREARAKSNGVLAVNIMSVLSNFSDLVETAIQEKIDIIFSGAGLPLDLPKYKPAGSSTKLVPIVSSVRAAKIIANKWLQNFDYLPDAFVVEGPDAGGHLGFSHSDLVDKKYNLVELVQQVSALAKELSEEHGKQIPIIAGGGIMTGKDIEKIMDAGADAVQLGTSFIATVECDASKAFKDIIVGAHENEIKLINSPVGMPGRAIGNDFLTAAENGERRPETCKHNCIKSCNPKTTKYCIAEALLAAFQGRFKDGFAFTGAYAHQIKGITSVKEVFQRLMTEYNYTKV